MTAPEKQFFTGIIVGTNAKALANYIRQGLEL